METKGGPAMPHFTITIAALRREIACTLASRLRDLEEHIGYAPAEDEPIALEEWWALPSTTPADCAWSLRCVEPQSEVEPRAQRYLTWCGARYPTPRTASEMKKNRGSWTCRRFAFTAADNLAREWGDVRERQDDENSLAWRQGYDEEFRDHAIKLRQLFLHEQPTATEPRS